MRPQPNTPRAAAPRARFSAILLLLAPLAACGGSAHDGPNVILITMDTTRPDFLSAYGERPEAKTPSLDALAAEGARFDAAMSASAVTPVSHATILTGEFPYTHGLRVLHADGGFRLPPDHPSVAKTLQEVGYDTTAVHSAFPVSRFFGFDRGFQRFEDLQGSMVQKGQGEDVRTGWDTDHLQRRSDETTDIALAHLENTDEPFFLWLHYWDPHDPTLFPPQEYMPGSPFSPEGKLLGWGDREYGHEITYMDAQIGRLFEGLKKLGVYDDTLIIVTADHGEGLSDGWQKHGWRSHRMVYEEQIRVPLIVRPPSSAPAKTKEIDGLVRTADIVPTILDYAGLEAPRRLDGESLRPLIEGGSYESRVGYADQVNGYDANAQMVKKRPDAAFLYCVRDGNWKLTYRPHDPNKSELFDLESDPDELNNLIGKRPEIVQRMMADLAKRQPWVLAPLPPDRTALSGDMAANLDALGYASGEIADMGWVWTCPQHRELRLPEKGRCEQCQAILVPTLSQ